MTTDDGHPRCLPDEVEETASQCLQAAFRVHSKLGARLLEKAYRDALAVELRHRGFEVETEVPVPIAYRDQDLGVGLRLDLRVEERVVIEVKSADGLTPAHTAQTLTYLKATGDRLGLLLNFGEPHLRDGLKRVIL